MNILMKWKLPIVLMMTSVNWIDFFMFIVGMALWLGMWVLFCDFILFVVALPLGAKPIRFYDLLGLILKRRQAIKAHG